jgi:hypothetical protein
LFSARGGRQTEREREREREEEIESGGERRDRITVRESDRHLLRDRGRNGEIPQTTKSLYNTKTKMLR